MNTDDGIDETQKQTIEDLVADVEDVTDPSSMDKVLAYLEQLQEEDEEFMELLAEKMQYHTIDWPQPWYQELNCSVSRSCYYKGNDENESDSFRTDPICKEEHDKIAKNWRKFKRKYNVPDKLICLARWRNKNGKKPSHSPKEYAKRFVAAYLAKGLNRNNFQVYRHITEYYAGHNKGVYTPTEKKVIEICFYHKPRMIGTILAKVLGRKPRGLYKILEEMRDGKPKKKRLKWDLKQATEFLKLLLKHTGLKLEELKNRIISTKIWVKVAKDMDHEYRYLHDFWYLFLHAQLFVRCDVKLNRLRKQLFKKLKASSYQVWSDIRWKDVALDFPDGMTPRFLRRICTTFVININKNYSRVPLQEIVDLALEKILATKKSKLKRNKRLKTLRLNDNGMLEKVDYRDTE